MNAILNFLLVGALSRSGGLELIGQWAFINAIVLTGLIADLGATNALTLRIGSRGLADSVPIIRRLLSVAIVLLFLFPLLGFFLKGYLAVALPIGLALAAASLQLISNWLIAIRMGLNEQYWFNIKSILRVLSQTGLALGFLVMFDDQPLLGFAFAILIASTLEVVYAAFLVRNYFRFSGTKAPFRTVINLLQGFGLLSVTQRAHLPVLQLILSTLADATIVGIFTVSVRLPIVISQSVSEALRVLLPGLARMKEDKNRPEVVQIVAEGVGGQFLLIFPAITTLFIFSPELLGIWLGDSSKTLESALRVICAGVFLSCLSVPHFWTLQSLGEIKYFSRLTFYRVVIVFASGSSALFFFAHDLVMPIIFSASLVVGGLISMYVAHSRLNILMPVIQILMWRNIVIFCILVVAFNLCLYLLTMEWRAESKLLFILVSNIFIMAPAVHAIKIKNWFFVDYVQE